MFEVIEISHTRLSDPSQLRLWGLVCGIATVWHLEDVNDFKQNALHRLQ